jgi:hypothetical protein
MPSPHSGLRFLVIATFLLIPAGCSQSKPPAFAPPHAEQKEQSAGDPIKVPDIASQEIMAMAKSNDSSRTCRDEGTIRDSERNRSACFHLQPAATTTKIVTKKATGKTAKSTAKKGQKTAPPASRTTETKVVQTTGRCQPQSLIYARCRTGITTCRLGDTSPVQWFACAKNKGYTSSMPVAGSVMVLDVNTRRGMPTGHPAYVEAVKDNKNGTWTLRISHTNYDRKCHLDQDATVLFDPKRMTASFATGPWCTWAKDLKALGFILR